jgi:hypothetical protein
MCGTCNKKEDLRINVPSVIDRKLFMEYVDKRENRALNSYQVWEYFNLIYNTNYVFNPKQHRRAVLNLDSIYFMYTRGELNDVLVDLAIPEQAYMKQSDRIKLDEYIYEQQNHDWILINEDEVITGGFIKKKVDSKDMADYAKKFNSYENISE